jgi:DNA-binding NarL/FixJ family response regulator
VINIFIADDHAIVRCGLRQVIEQQRDMRVVGEASDGRAVLLASDRDTWDLLILDLSLPKVGGIEVLRRLRQDSPQLKIVVYSMYPEDQYGLRLIHEGAAAYISKDLDVVELMQALRAVASGGTYLSKALTEQIRLGAMNRSSPAHGNLSAREHQVFTLVIQGRTVSEIAAELNLSVSTVSNHLAKIKDKLGARTIADIVSYAHRMGLLGEN